MQAGHGHEQKNVLKTIIDVDSRGEVIHICLTLCSAGWRGGVHFFGAFAQHAGWRSNADLSTIEWRLCSAVRRDDADFVLWNACYFFLLPPFEGHELFSERKLKKITDKSTFLLTHFNNCFWPTIARKIDLTRFQNL